jgi:hypothetical protein
VPGPLRHDIDHNNFGLFLGKKTRRGLAYAGTAAGYQGHFTR